MTLDWTQGSLAEGLRLYETGEFFAAHEAWESRWLESQEPEKTFLQGLIQVAAAFHHYSRANRQGTQNLLQAGLIKIERFPHTHRGLALEPLRVAVRRWLAALEDGEDPAENESPQIEHRGEG